MIYLLDSVTVIHAVNGSLAVAQRVNDAEQRGDRIVTSVIAQAEMVFGAENSPKREANLRRLREKLARMEVLPVTAEVADKYGELRAYLQARGRNKTDLDLLIAATAVVVGATLVTDDGALLAGDIPGLRVENWV